MCSADGWLQMVHRAGKPIWGKPFGQCIRLQECAIDFLRTGRQDAVKAYHVGLLILLWIEYLRVPPRTNQLLLIRQ